MLTRKKFRYNVVLPTKPYTKIKERKSLEYFEGMSKRVLNTLVDPSLYIVLLYLEALDALRKETSIWNRKVRREISYFIWEFELLDTLLNNTSYTLDEMRRGTAVYAINEVDIFVESFVLGVIEDMNIRILQFELFKQSLKS